MYIINITLTSLNFADPQKRPRCIKNYDLIIVFFKCNAFAVRARPRFIAEL